MRKSQLLYITAVTICPLRNGISRRQTHSQAEYAPQSTRPATVAGRAAAAPRAALQLHFTCHTYKVNGAFLFAV